MSDDMPQPGEPKGVYEILEAWQAGEITTVRALALTGCENVEELYQAARSSGIEIRFQNTQT
jgi:hypothetical protein